MHCSLTVCTASEREHGKFELFAVYIGHVHENYVFSYRTNSVISCTLSLPLSGGMELLLRLLLMWQSECALWIYVIYKVNRWKEEMLCVYEFNEERQLYPSGCSVRKLPLNFQLFSIKSIFPIIL